MLYLLDANVLITANNSYYAIDQVPEYWEWVHHQAISGRMKIPREIMDEIEGGRKDNDPLLDWLSVTEIKAALVQRTVSVGYAANLTDDEVEKIGRDPFLVAYALASPADRMVVTLEASRPTAQRQNRKIPDVCQALGVQSCGPVAMNRTLGFSTRWKNGPL